MYFAHLLDKSGVAFNPAHYRDIHGAIDPELLSKAVDAALNSVSTYCVRVELNEETPYIRDCGGVEGALSHLDVSQEANPLDAALRWMESERNLPFDLESGPLFRIALIKLGPAHHFLFHCFHHIIVDGAGVYQLERWVFEIYDDFKSGRAVDVPCNQSDALDVEERYRNSPSFADDKKYWLETLRGLEAQVSLSGKDRQTDRGVVVRETIELSDSLVQDIKDFCARNKVALQRALIALSALYYARMTNQSDIVVDMPVALRPRNEDQLAVDMRSNIVHLRLNIDPQQTYKNLFEQLKKNLRDGIRHSQYRYEDIQRDLNTQDAISRFSVNLQPSTDLRVIDGLTIVCHRLYNGPVQETILSFYVDKGSEKIAISLDGNSLLYTKTELDAHLNRIVHFLSASSETSPEDLVASLPLVDNFERDRVLKTFNQSLVAVAPPTLGAAVTATPEVEHGFHERSAVQRSAYSAVQCD